MSNVLLQNDEARPEMDDLLRDYFHTEMPKPWPAFHAPKPARAKQPGTFWSRYSGRLALAASVALLVGGYWTLAGFFPNATTGRLDQVIDPIGHKDGSKKPKTTNLPEKALDVPMPMPMP